MGVSFFTSLFMFAEFGVGIGFGSLALLADAFHMLSDLLSLIIGGAAIHVSGGCVCVCVSRYKQHDDTLGNQNNSTIHMDKRYHSTTQLMHHTRQ